MRNLIPIWAGIECTVNRVGDSFFNQCQKNGHDSRIEDLELFAQLGIERIRYPFLWETAFSNDSKEWNWTWADERTRELQRVGLTPIAGLVHHGSGPIETHLLDSAFPERLAKYARAFAERYPWITDYTPVNEPLTTARFSGLYGIWYPHGKSDFQFLRALLNEIKGTVLAMREIRKINPRARLIQTEDLGTVQGTNLLQYQVEFENHRRWLSFDLLTGNVGPDHFLYDYLRQNGATESELQWFIENKCSPDILGINHYPLSNRFLDHRLDLYPTEFHGGNGIHQYADVGSVDTKASELFPLEDLLSATWNRFQLPIAITEVHVQSSRENQLRWFLEVAQAAQQARDQRGVNVQAITAWSLLGSYDWNTLCTVENMHYESGVFDLRAPRPRATALCQVIKSWSQGEIFQHPVLEEKGWWHHRDKVSYGPERETIGPNFLNERARPLVITGANGTLGKAFARVCEIRNIPYKALSRKEMEITDSKSIEAVFSEIRPWAVINTAGFVRVDEAESAKEQCFRENVIGPENLARACADRKIPLLHFSTDLVFDGNSESPYMENSNVSPLNVYGESKAASERKVLEIHPKSLVIRTSSFFSPWDQHNFVFSVLNTLRQGLTFQAASDVTISPTYVPDLVDLSLDLLLDGEYGLLHQTNQGHLTWARLAELTTELAIENKLISLGSSARKKIQHLSSDEMNYAAKRPRFSALNSSRVQVLPSYEKSLEVYFSELTKLKKKNNEFFWERLL